MNNMKKYFVCQEDSDIANVFSLDDFDKNGYLDGYAGEDGYHIDDFEDKVWFKTFDEAAEYAESINDAD